MLWSSFFVRFFSFSFCYANVIDDACRCHGVLVVGGGWGVESGGGGGERAVGGKKGGVWGWEEEVGIETINDEAYDCNLAAIMGGATAD